jgi:hypothetical protein
VRDRSDRIIALAIDILDICLGLQCQVNTKQSCTFRVIASHPYPYRYRTRTLNMITLEAPVISNGRDSPCGCPIAPE